MEYLYKPYIYGKGLEIFQGSQTKVTKQLMNEILDTILIKKCLVNDIHTIVNKYRNIILNKQITDPSLITIIKKVGRIPESYKNLPIHVKLALDRKEKHGEFFYTSMRVPFIVLKEKPLKIIHSSEYTGNYDEKYYWYKQVYPPTYRLLKIVFQNEDWDKYFSIDKYLQTKLGILLNFNNNKMSINIIN